VLGSQLAYNESSFATSSWGMRGTEDLGGGMKANFNLESDILTNSGGSHSSGLFRRAAWVSLADAKLGEVFMGRRSNVYVLATGQILPVSGNLAHGWRTVTGSSVGDQISNQVTYATPTIMATTVAVQIGLNNTTNNGDDGTMFASHLVNKSIKNLTFLAGYNNMKGVRATTTTLGNTAAANATVNNREGYAVGLKYKLTPAIEVGTGYNHGRNNAGGSAGVSATNSSAGQGIFGVGYQATPKILLGANYAKTTFQAQMVNLQAHYMLSKRTRLYTQLTFTQAAKGNNQVGGTLANSYSPLSCNSSTTSCNTAIAGSSGNHNNPGDANGYVMGLIHTF
jgi:predicted porin